MPQRKVEGDWMSSQLPREPMESITRSSYPQHTTARQDLRMAMPDHSGPEHRVPGPVPQQPDKERWLPGNSQTAFMNCSGAHSFVPRRRKIGPMLHNNAIFDLNYMGDCGDDGVVPKKSPDISSITGREFTRRKRLDGPSDHLEVQAFDGGAPGRAPKPSEWYKS